jgi:signal peptidase II
VTTPPKSIGDRLLAYRRLLTVAIIVLAGDQLTKALVSARLPYPTYGEGHGAIVVIRNFFYLVHVGNTGAAWSIFTGQSVMLAALALVTLVGIFIWRRALGLRDRGTQLCFGLLCGGILGNVVDRLRYGHVIDFLDFHFGSYVYPTFNIADSGICVGVMLYLFQSLREPKPEA